jgi:predicted N-acetyltransferase YhbS
MTQSYPIRTIAADEFGALFEVSAEAFLETGRPEILEHERKVAEYDRTIAAIDGEQLVGSGCAYSFRLTVPGGAVPAAGVSLIAVLPSHRRRGILTGLMDYLPAGASRWRSCSPPNPPSTAGSATAWRRCISG